MDYLNATGEKVGLVKVRLYRPFCRRAPHRRPARHRQEASRSWTARKEPGAIGEPLYLDVVRRPGGHQVRRACPIIGGRYGLGSKDTTPGRHHRRLTATWTPTSPKTRFTIGIDDDVTNLSLPVDREPRHRPPRAPPPASSGAWAPTAPWAPTRTPSRSSATTPTCMPRPTSQYDSKKSGGVTISHLRFGKKPDQVHLLRHARPTSWPATTASYVEKYDMVQDIKPGGTFLLNCAWDVEELEQPPPRRMPSATWPRTTSSSTPSTPSTSAKELGLGNRTNTILQAAFFKLAKVIPVDEAVQLHEGRRRQEPTAKQGRWIVIMNNYNAVDAGVEERQEGPRPAWAGPTSRTRPPPSQVTDRPESELDLSSRTC